MVWLLWVYTTWVASWLDPRRIAVRLLLLGLAGASLVGAAADELTLADPEAVGPPSQVTQAATPGAEPRRMTAEPSSRLLTPTVSGGPMLYVLDDYRAP